MTSDSLPVDPRPIADIVHDHRLLAERFGFAPVPFRGIDPSTLTDEEFAVYVYWMSMPGLHSERAWRERRRRGGGVGYNDLGQLVIGLPGGGEQVIDE